MRVSLIQSYLRDFLSNRALGPMAGLPWRGSGKLTSDSVDASLPVLHYEGPEICTVADFRHVAVSTLPQILTRGPFRHHIGIVFDKSAPNEAHFRGSNGEPVAARYFTFLVVRRPDGSYISRGSAIVPIIPHVRSPAGYEVVLTAEVRSHCLIDPPQRTTYNKTRSRFISWSSDDTRTVTFPRGIGRKRPPLVLARGESLAFPGGTVDPSDPNLAAGAIRELLEESGFTSESTLLARAIRDSNARRVFATDAVRMNDTYIVQLPRGTIVSKTIDDGGTLRVKTFSPDEVRFLIDIGEIDAINTALDPWAFFEDVLRRGRQMHALGRIQIGYVDLVIPTKKSV